ncbi:MAG: nucleotide exchange factor GrpE [Desulfocapsaceae bacterium]|nr:nucleotide exchange factor GrpE [Desulfocapsaceae bacterium]
MSKKQQKDDLVEETMDAQTESDGAEEETASPTDGDETPDDESGDLQKQLAEAKEEVIDLKDKMLRLAADYENYKKRNERERATAMKFAGEQIFREFLPVVDNLERAVSQGVVGDNDSEEKLASLLKGVELTLEGLYKSLDKFEVKPFESQGMPFDPNKQEAMTMEPSETVPENHVVQEYEKGYFYKDRLLRAAKVTVSSGKAEK